MHWLLLPLVFVLLQPLEQPRFDKVGSGQVEVTVPLPAELFNKVKLGPVDPDLGESWLRLTLVNPDTGKPGPALVGAYRRSADKLIFKPRVSLAGGQLYRASAGPETGATASRDYRAPSRIPSKEIPRVVKVFPTGDVLPANHLRFHIVFATPMRGGQDIFRQISILDENGQRIDDAWLLDEIWDETDQVLILYIHPGRIKWGLVLREVMGPVLVEKRRYTLVIRQEMIDSEGRKLEREFRKEFRTTPEERTRLELKEWRLESPAAGTTQPLVARFPGPLDAKSLEKFLTVADAKGQAVTGTIKLGEAEKSWAFTPAQPWAAGAYHLKVNPRFEDTAGNTPTRPFDLDLTAPRLQPQALDLPFQAKALPK